MSLAEITVPPPPAGRYDWNDDGVVILKGLIPDDTIAAYRQEWWAANGRGDLPAVDVMRQPFILDSPRRGGYPYDVPYRHNRALRDLVCDEVLASGLKADRKSVV